MVFNKMEEGVLRLLEVFIKTDSGKAPAVRALYLLPFWAGKACPRQIWGGASCTWSGTF